jgi:hypothetical protein
VRNCITRAIAKAIAVPQSSWKNSFDIACWEG